MKTDDDAFVNMFSLMPRLHELATNDTSQSSMLLMCNVFLNDPVDLRPDGKWRVPRTTWRHDYWPTFCEGIAFVMTWNFVTSAHQLVHRVPRLWIDDVTY